MGALQLKKQGAGKSIIAKNLREDQHPSKKPSLSRNLSEEEETTYKLFSLPVGEHWKKT
jgi:hypothetical protein